ncbi:MAG: imidazoleglycerol-phosphate dehydratase HisB [Phycisphaerales bacterium JB043]
MSDRVTSVERTTRETQVELTINLDGQGTASVNTGLGFFDHMLTALATHAWFDLDLRCAGDLEVDDHHTVEDCAIVMGEAIRGALGDRRGIRRFASSYAPLDESLARVVVDLSGRASAEVNLGLKRDRIGAVACENITHFFTSFAMAARLTLHVDVLRGENDHHKAEAAFKALALAMREAVASDGVRDRVPSTKGVL